MKRAGRGNLDRRFGLIVLGVMLLLIVVISILAPAAGDGDQTPTSYNTGAAGAKAAYLLMNEIGYSAEQWDAPPDRLAELDAADTTLILANPDYRTEDEKQARAEITSFLARGGHVLATGAAGAYLLPGGRTVQPTNILSAVCRTTPQALANDEADPMALAGRVTLPEIARWDPAVRTIHDPTGRDNPVSVSQRCGADAVVVSFSYGAGHAVWWSSPQPLTNSGLKEDASLKLLLASLPPPAASAAKGHPAIVFDEYFHGDRTTLWETARGLPIYQLLAQCGLVAVLLVLSFGRRNGPLRMPVQVPRSSPIEFAESMGRLYRRAGATSAATEGARRRLLQFLAERCGVSREVLGGGPDAIVETLRIRYGGDWTRLGEHLKQAAEAEFTVLAPRSALELVRALDRDRLELLGATRAARPIPRASAA
jgi:Domain of unknown function (DUF4350)